LDEPAVAALLSETHCLVHPTFFDSFGIVVLEALAAGCAIIATDMASLSELVTRENGFLLPLPIGGVVGGMTIPQFSAGRDFCALLDHLSLHGFEQDLTAAMAAMASDRMRREQCRAASRDLYRTRFSLETWKANMHADLRDAFPELNASSKAI
jgi:glycosyltransferase involved in cell wall biosynthesis